MRRNTRGLLLVCYECDPPWVGTGTETFCWTRLGDFCPQCGNPDLYEIKTTLEPEAYRALIAKGNRG